MAVDKLDSEQAPAMCENCKVTYLCNLEESSGRYLPKIALPGIAKELLGLQEPESHSSINVHCIQTGLGAVWIGNSALDLAQKQGQHSSPTYSTSILVNVSMELSLIQLHSPGLICTTSCR